MFEWIANYCLVGLLWAALLRYRYMPGGGQMAPVNWLLIVAIWPITFLAFVQGCIFGKSSD
ncbi:MAG: hypothetical protein QF521_19225 [Alphaproteobacteria bacterium]|nr:hypothetical protein [Alphaproteobacteria bacterium]MDP6875661.1 hypothetical protein [Alphaproteobacteria bacterium]